jgi:hypothetical protein
VFNFSVAELQCYSVGRSGVLVHNTNSGELPPNANRLSGPDGIEELYSRLDEYHGINEYEASERLHAGKQALGIPADANLLFDLTGNVYDPVTLEWLFSLTTGR